MQKNTTNGPTNMDLILSKWYLKVRYLYMDVARMIYYILNEKYIHNKKTQDYIKIYLD